MQVKNKKVFHLRKTGSARPQPQQQKVIDNQQTSQSPAQNQNKSTIYLHPNKEKALTNQNLKSQAKPLQKQQQIILASYPQITIDQQQLQFNEKIGNVQVKNIKVKNVGCSAIYYQWSFKNLPKINPSAIKDPKPNFYCHYQPNVIKPGESAIFTFSFYSETPGIIVQEVQLICNPEPATPIAPIRLKGNAFIQDNLKVKRQKLAKQLKQRQTQAFTKEVVSDIVNRVKSPVPPLPDVSNPEIAEKQFQQANSNLKLYYNKQVNNWFNALYIDICYESKIPQQSRHWNQSIFTLAEMIENVKDPILKQSFDKRLKNYKSLSSTRPPQKSDLFPKIKSTLLQVGYLLGGSISDESKKQLEMWETPFEQPSEHQTQQEIAAKKDEKTKIIGQWAKKMKKKKWGPDEQNELLNNYRSKLQKGVSKALIQKLDGFDDQASFESCKAKIKQKFDNESYFSFLQRLKSVEQFSIEGKKILLKFDLKLKQNSGEALVKLQQYLLKKKQQQLRLEQQKKNQQSSKAKKKAPVQKKKKGQKEQQQQKALSFDFKTLLDNQSWQGFISTLKFILQKQPFLLIIGISYGPKTGVFTQKFSIKFLLQCLTAIQPSIQFLQHKHLFQLKQKLQQQTLNEGSIYLAQNLSFLPCQGMQTGSIKIIQKILNGQTKKIQTIQSHKMLMSQVQKQLQIIMPAIDIIVREDRFVNRVSGICSYGKKTSILGLSWWKYIAFALRTQGSNLLLGGNFQPEKLVLISKLTKFCNKFFVGGQIGVKIWMAVNGLKNFYGVQNTKNQQNLIKYFLQQQKISQTFQKIVLPQDFILQVHKQNQNIKINYKQGDKIQQQNTKVVDIGHDTCQLFTKLQNNHLFIIDYPSINRSQISSLEKLSKILYTKKQNKKLRHQQQQSTPAGINYQKDLVIYIVGIKQQDFEKIQLKQKKNKPKEGQQQEQQLQAEPEEEIKKIDQICDFRISDAQFFNRILAAEFSYGLKDISKYPKSD